VSIVAIDSTFLLVVLHPTAPIPKDPSTGKPWEKGRERVEYLIERLSDEKATVIIPTPVLSEVFVRAGPKAINDYLAGIRSTRCFRIGPFDQKAAVEVAMMTDAALAAGRKRGASTGPWQKVKIDRQIVAIAKAEGADLIYSSDKDIRNLAIAERLNVEGFGDLPQRPVSDQGELDLEQPEDE
jgi:hypothetical protein